MSMPRQCQASRGSVPSRSWSVNARHGQPHACRSMPPPGGLSRRRSRPCDVLPTGSNPHRVTALLKWWQPGYVLVSWSVLGVAAGGHCQVVDPTA
jgi:hypothetical protein